MQATAAEQMTRSESGALGSSLAACCFVSAADFGPIMIQVETRKIKLAASQPASSLDCQGKVSETPIPQASPIVEAMSTLRPVGPRRGQITSETLIRSRADLTQPDCRESRGNHRVGKCGAAPTRIGTSKAETG